MFTTKNAIILAERFSVNDLLRDLSIGGKAVFVVIQGKYYKQDPEIVYAALMVLKHQNVTEVDPGRFINICSRILEVAEAEAA